MELGQVLYLGRAFRTKETLPDFREWCRVTRHPRVFRGLTGYQRTPWEWGVTSLVIKILVVFNIWKMIDDTIVADTISKNIKFLRGKLGKCKS